MGWPGWYVECPPKPPHHSSIWQKTKINNRLVGWDKDRESSFSSYHHDQNSLDLGGKNQSRIMKKTPKSWKHLTSLPVFFLALGLLLIFFTTFFQVVQGDEVGATFSFMERTSHTAPEWGPSYRTQSSINFSSVNLFHRLHFCCCSSVCSFHGVKFFRSTLLHCGSPTGSCVLPADLLQCRLLFLKIHRPCQRPAAAWASGGVTTSFGHSSPPWTSMGCMDTGTACLTTVFTTGCRKSLLQCLEHLFPLLFHWPWCLQSCFSHTVSLLSCCSQMHRSIFSPF